MRLATIMTFLLTHLKSVRRSRLTTLASLVYGVLHGGRASVTAIGRSLPGPAHIKHKIKRVDRFLANPSISFSLVAPLLLAFLPRNQRLIVLIDWTSHDRDRLQTLTAQVPVNGRCLPILARTYWRQEPGQSQQELAFLKELQPLLWEWKEIVVLFDGGFRCPFRKAVAALGWDYIGRLRGDDHIAVNGEWCRVDREVLRRQELRDYGWTRIGKTLEHPEGARVVAYFAPKGASRPRTACERRNMQAGKYRAKAKNPWFLTTTLTRWSAAEVVRGYAQRFQIEESFRDWKNHRFTGYQLDEVTCSSPERLERLLAVAAVAYAFQLAHGLAAEAVGWEPQFRVNRSPRRQIGAFVLGGLVLQVGRVCNWKTLGKAVREACQEVWNDIRSGPLEESLPEAA